MQIAKQSLTKKKIQLKKIKKDTLNQGKMSKINALLFEGLKSREIT